MTSITTITSTTVETSMQVILNKFNDMKLQLDLIEIEREKKREKERLRYLARKEYFKQRNNKKKMSDAVARSITNL